ncbi:hypothetical protein PTSG_06033 [Salpingoeca rosetta]|uniref:Uncharacterized protein n=1 Tax=Salpingoeca rosetta (strain ATCC 50818 / BSB-021) TaxID=946362 RepID=F2UDH3_SALR5|nr:uncharacterized protein PTSG_06033 [Salpingoeca rosetta]EGD74668.1 hypothetical protein PTSG_06033 [Salpingoeca rosetta]|eukprot:XP_004992925.1 hypothetical protein PTSG_06033 [Salpingoeca rosetta]
MKKFVSVTRTFASLGLDPRVAECVEHVEWVSDLVCKASDKVLEQLLQSTEGVDMKSELQERIKKRKEEEEKKKKEKEKEKSEKKRKRKRKRRRRRRRKGPGQGKSSAIPQVDGFGPEDVDALLAVICKKKVPAHDVSTREAQRVLASPRRAVRPTKQPRRAVRAKKQPYQAPGLWEALKVSTTAFTRQTSALRGVSRTMPNATTPVNTPPQIKAIAHNLLDMTCRTLQGALKLHIRHAPARWLRTFRYVRQKAKEQEQEDQEDQEKDSVEDDLEYAELRDLLTDCKTNEERLGFVFAVKQALRQYSHIRYKHPPLLPLFRGTRHLRFSKSTLRLLKIQPRQGDGSRLDDFFRPRRPRDHERLKEATSFVTDGVAAHVCLQVEEKPKGAAKNKNGGKVVADQNASKGKLTKSQRRTRSRRRRRRRRRKCRLRQGTAQPTVVGCDPGVRVPVTLACVQTGRVLRYRQQRWANFLHCRLLSSKQKKARREKRQAHKEAWQAAQQGVEQQRPIRHPHTIEELAHRQHTRTSSQDGTGNSCSMAFWHGGGTCARSIASR